MEIIEAEHLGYCFGVKNAVETARRAIEDGRCAGAPVYACGPIIHNTAVCRHLEDMGLITVGNIEDVPFGALVVVRSHGEGKLFFDRAAEKGVSVIDATCPKVRRIQKLAKQASEEGRTVVIIGDAAHPEVRGVSGWCAGEVLVAASSDEAAKIASETAQSNKNLFVVSQTTFDKERFAEIAAVFRATAGVDIRIENTICEATRERQDACAKLAENVGIMLVIGDKTSSNTQKLYDIAEKSCKNTFFIENIKDLPLQKIVGCNTIGITAGASTPKQLIKEVITSMSEFNNESNEFNPMNDFMDEIDKALRLPRNGDIITGEVIQVTEKDVIVNIGCKKDGIIPRNEVTLETDQSMFDVFKEGDEVQAKVLKNDDGDGNILLSKKRVIVSEHWEDINKAFEERTPIEVSLIKEVNGGVIANFNEINGFIPMSQLSDRYVEKADEFIGKTLPVKIMRVDQKRNKVVFSHKAVLNEERQKRMLEVWDTINVGDIIDGKVMRFTEYGAFVDIGGIDGLLHISEISWGKLRHPEEVLKIDQEIKVKVLSMNKEKEKISLGYKQNLPEPWTVINDKYQVGQVISGKAVQLKDYGVFVELEPGLDGLVHISEIAFRRVNNISEEIVLGQDITAKILEIDKDRKRISLSIKETLDRDEEELREGASARQGHESFGEKVKDAFNEAAERVEAAAEKVAEVAGEFIDKVEDVAHDVVDKIEDKADDIKDKIDDAVEEFKEDITGEESVRDEEPELPDSDAEPAVSETETEEEAEESFAESVPEEAANEEPVEAEPEIAEAAPEETVEAANEEPAETEVAETVAEETAEDAEDKEATDEE